MARPAVVVALPRDERNPVLTELREAGFDAISVDQPEDMAVLLESDPRVAVAILDGESDMDTWLEFYSLLHENGRDIPALMLVSPRALDRFASGNQSAIDDEFLARPYSAESLRWRVEAICIRLETVDDGSGPVIQTGEVGTGDWARRATLVAVFNPKGGVGKTTVATNLAAILQVRKGQKVLLVDADTVSGHVTTSLGIEQVRTVYDSWRDEAEGGAPESLVEVAAAHQIGIRVAALTSSPLHVDLLEPARVSAAIAAARRAFDFIVIDLHPSYSPINQAIFELADRILVPVTPDVPALRAAVQLRDVADEIGLRDKLAMVVNRANSGVSVADMERTVGMPALALIRSGGLLFVRAANEGRTVIEMFPRERVSQDFEALADRLLGTRTPEPAASRSPFRFFGRQKEPVRA